MFLSVFVISGGTAVARVIHVDKRNIGGVHDGWTWGTAYQYLKLALDVAVSGDQIWVAKGTYRPDEWGSSGRSATFQLKSGVIVKGGFAGHEDCPGQEDWRTHTTILSGNIGWIKLSSDNSYHVVTGSGTDGTAILDGFWIMGGYADGISNDHGAGMYNIAGSPTVKNCRFMENYAEMLGGGIYNKNSSAHFFNCVFDRNDASSGAGIYNINNSSIELVNCSFMGNEANRGGGMYNTLGSDATLVNCIFSGNSADIYGGGMYNHSSDPTLTNCSWSANTATLSGGGMHNYTASPLLTSCILWGNTPEQISNLASSSPTLNYCDIQGGWGGSGGNNIASNPLFTDANGADNIHGTADDNLRPDAGSPCIDAGDNAVFPSFPAADLDYHRRFTDDPTIANTGGGTAPIIDMGAYERIQPIYVDADSQGGGDGTSWALAFNDLQDALSAAERYDWNDVLWVAEGTYKPDSGTNRFSNFRLAYLVLYGGFAGTETALDQRDWRTHETILSGDLGHAENLYDNSYHVIYIELADATTILDGFTVTGGMANDFDNLSAEYKKGAGVYNKYANPTIVNCTFRWNRAAELGGGMYNLFSSPLVVNCVFSGNAADTEIYVDGSGGAMCNSSSYPRVINCTFTGNWADNLGAGMYNYGGGPTVKNSIFWENSRNYSGMDETAQICGDAAVSATCIQDLNTFAGNDNIGDNPLLVDADGPDNDFGTADDNPRLSTGSPCLDTGDNASVPPEITTDFEGEDRIFDGDSIPGAVVDMGADEYLQSSEVWVDDDYGNPYPGNGTLTNPFHKIQNGIDAVASSGTVHVANGTYTGTGNKNLDFKGKAITVQSENGPEDCIIDCENAGRGFYFHNGEGQDAVVSGFTITNGYGYDGGAIRCTDSSSPSIINCIILGNESTDDGGAVYCHTASPIFINCIISSNQTLDDGGGVHLYNSSPSFINCSIAYNSADSSGGGVNVTGSSSPELTNCILWGNTPDQIAGASATVTYSDVQGGFAGAGNIDQDPLLAAPNRGDYHLRSGSACIDAGNNTAVPGWLALDFEGDDRIIDGDSVPGAVVDMGADEYIDTDGDGVQDSEEMGPDGNDPDYDGNGDGTPDSEQDNVASMHTYDGENYITLASPEETAMRDVRAVERDDAPAEANYPHGFFGFEVHGLSAPRDCTEVTLFLPLNPDINTYWKYGRTHSDPTDHWYKFPYDHQTGAEIFHEPPRTRIVLHLCDNLRGDDDLDANGVIEDIGGPAITAVTCDGDFDQDGDVDGSDLAIFAAGGTGITLEDFAADFGTIY